jgi:two-component system, cell cycle sensor histidine kinase PleC
VIASLYNRMSDSGDGNSNGHAILPRVVSLAVHELRTPVTVVAGYLRMLLREQGGPLTDKQRKMLEEADRSCSRIGGLVAEMSEFSKLEAQELGLVRADLDLAALVAEVASGMHDNDRGVRLDVRGADRPLMVSGDRPRLAAAVKALLHSAIRERGEPGVVVVTCSAREGTPPWAIVAVGDDALVATLADSASAQPLPSFDEWRGGMGLALPVARRVLEAHGGAVWSAADSTSRAAAALRLPLAK